MLEPTSPSTPPPPRPTERPLDFFAASMWVIGAHIGFLWLAFLMIALRESASRDLVSQVMCQVIAYGLTLFLILRVHAPNTSIRQFVTWRRAHPAFFLLGGLLGLASAPPAAWILGQLHRAFPSADSASGIAEIFQQAGTLERVGMGLAVVVLGPLAEELIFRGAIFGPLLRYRPRPRVVIVFTSMLFAVVHLDPLRMAPIFLVGLLLGVCRYASRSVLPGYMLHMCFNAIPIASMALSEDLPEPGAPAEVIDPTLALAGLFVAAACTAAIVTLGRRQASSD